MNLIISSSSTGMNSTCFILVFCSFYICSYLQKPVCGDAVASATHSLQYTPPIFKNSSRPILIMYVGEDPVFRQKEVLFPDYIPDHLPHREKEIKSVSSIINSALKNRSQISNIFIYGPPGTGKTASIRFIFRKLEEESMLENYIEGTTLEIFLQMMNGKIK